MCALCAKSDDKCAKVVMMCKSDNKCAKVVISDVNYSLPHEYSKTSQITKRGM